MYGTDEANNKKMTKNDRGKKQHQKVNNDVINKELAQEQCIPEVMEMKDKL